MPLSCMLALLPSAASIADQPARPSDLFIRQLDELSALWSFYKRHSISNGRVISHDENGITTSEGQGYAMLRAVWSNDRTTFTSVWSWTKQHLQVREDKLFAWKWKGKVLLINSATDADTDIALALILASRRFSEPSFATEARQILNAIRNAEILAVGDRYFVTAGNWAVQEEYPTIHVAYLAPYAYEIFATVDPDHPWQRLVESSYRILHWLYFDRRLPLPPEIIWLDRHSGDLFLSPPRSGATAGFGYDAMPLFWRVALDTTWFGRREADLRSRMLAFFDQEWQKRRAFFDHYALTGEPRSSFEGLPLYATVHALALRDNPNLARLIHETKLRSLYAKALAGKDTPYYLHNWLWFDRALELQQLRTYDEFLGFLRPFDFQGFAAHFPWEVVAVAMVLFFLARLHPVFKLAFVTVAFYLCGRYLVWRLLDTLNFLEPGGPFISLSLWAAECYAFTTVVLLLIQVGLRNHRPGVSPPDTPAGFAPSVDILIPIYSESCSILEKTLIAACAIEYPRKRIYVLDDGHRDEVARLAESYGAVYLRGPRRHAKAGNLNQALRSTDGELIVVFDTDHIPATTFLAETVPHFSDPRVGFVQTPHHFYNQDIFQRAFVASRRTPQRARPVQSRHPRTQTPLERGIFRRKRSGIPAFGDHGHQRLQPPQHHGGHPYQPTPPCGRLALGFRGQGPGGGPYGRKPVVLSRPAAAVDAGMPANFLQGQSSAVPRPHAAAAARLFRLALLLFLSRGPRRFLDHPALLPAVPSPPDLFRTSPCWSLTCFRS